MIAALIAIPQLATYELRLEKTRPNSWAKQLREIEWGHWSLEFMIYEILHIWHVLHILHIQRQGRFQHITLFSTQSFMRTTSIIRRQKANEYKMTKTKIQTTELSWSFHFLNI